MKKHYTKFSMLFLAIIIFSANSFAQNNKSLWTKASNQDFINDDLSFRKVEPLKGQYFQLDIEELRQILATVPKRSATTETSNSIVNFPNANGEMEAYRVMEASIMHPDLQVRYPNIRSYVGQSVENPSKTIRFSVTPQGLHTMTLSGDEGTQFIDPYTKNNNVYITYSKRDLPKLENNFICYFDDEVSLDQSSDFNNDTARNANDGMKRDFRLALASTIEYSSFHWMAAGLTAGDTEAAKKAAVLAAMNVTMTRINGVYERDLSITMTLVANNDSLIFINSDSFDNNNANTLIAQSQTVINGAIGTANYDIGHTFSTGGGGLASLGSVCVNGSKARGITGGPSPVGDAYDIDFVAHEMGHQFGAPHTFNGDQGNCAGGNRTASNAYEVGSGTTIMAYAGICGSDNVQANSDAYFHQKSLQMIWNNVTTGSSQCAAQTATGNSAPTANAGSNYTIPGLTPYKLTGTSTDVDGTNSHTFTWEQYDLGPAGVPTETTTTGPLARSFEGTTNPTRYIPNLPDLYSSAGSTDWEKLASVNRDLNFQLTVRDNDSRGGQTATDNMSATVNAAAGPFKVTSQNTNTIVWTPGMTETITWDVAGTTANGINTANVNILLSTDGGLTYGTTLIPNTPNDGSEVITVPSASAAYCRIMVEAANNIFFNINDNFFAIGNYTYVPGDICDDYFFNANVLLDENDTTFSGFVLTVNDSKTISDLNISLDVTTTNNAEIFTAIRGPFETTELNFLARGTCPGATDLILTFDDEGNATNCNDTASNDNVLPFDPLSFADGQNSMGDWIFFIGDVLVDGNRSTWNNITLTICETGGFIPVLSVDEFSLEDSLLVYPNPNNGEFNVKFKSASSQDINIQVFDIRGRSVLNQSFNNTGDFNQNINLNKVQSGMYLLNVNDGEKKATKKIIIN